MHPKRTTPSEEEAAVANVYDGILREVIVDVACGIHRAAKTGVLPYADIMAGPSAAAVGAGRFAAEGGGNGTASDANAAVKEETGKGPKIEAAGDEAVATDAAAASAAESQASHFPDAERTKEGAPSDANKVAGSNDVAVGSVGTDAKKRKVESEEGKEKPSEEPKEGTAKAGMGSSPAKGTPAFAPSPPKTDIYGRTPGKEPGHSVPCPNNCRRQISVGRMALHLEKCLGLSTRRGHASQSSASSASHRGSAKGSKGAGRGSGKGGSGRGGAGRGGKVSRQQGKAVKRKSSKIM